MKLRAQSSVILGRKLGKDREVTRRSHVRQKFSPRGMLQSFYE